MPQFKLLITQCVQWKPGYIRHTLTRSQLNGMRWDLRWILRVTQTQMTLGGGRKQWHQISNSGQTEKEQVDWIENQVVLGGRMAKVDRTKQIQKERESSATHIDKLALLQSIFLPTGRYDYYCHPICVHVNKCKWRCHQLFDWSRWARHSVLN